MKNQGKSDKIFFYVPILCGIGDKFWGYSLSCLTCVRTRAPFNSDVDFLLSQVSHSEKKGAKKQPKIQ